MKYLLSFCSLALVTCLSACTPQGSGDNPRDRKGVDGTLTWRVVSDQDGQAAFLSRPGAAPDLVLWCRNNGLLTLRAHIFEAPTPRPDLVMSTSGGVITFQNVRRQGGVRAGDRKLVEGSVALTQAEIPAVLQAANSLSISSGGVVFEAKDTDPTAILPQFTTACLAPSTPKKAEPTL